MAALLLAVAQAATPSVLFNTPRSLFTGYYPNSAVVADFNGDGIADLAISHGGIDAGAVSISLGNGDGTFQPEVSYATGSVADSVAVGDFNGDGILDLAVANSYGSGAPVPYGTVSILLGNGDGTFQPAVSYDANSYPGAVAVGDFNGDGALDLVVANNYQYQYTVSILLGNGDGTFQSPVVYAVGNGPVSLVVGDFDGDQNLDIVVANSGSNDLSILLGNGDGTFQPQTTYALSAAPTFVTAADFTGDEARPVWPKSRRRPAFNAVCKTISQSMRILLGRLALVIMDACKLSSRRRVATTACAVLPTPGIVG
jgi:hypothetical protein